MSLCQPSKSARVSQDISPSTFFGNFVGLHKANKIQERATQIVANSMSAGPIQTDMTWPHEIGRQAISRNDQSPCGITRMGSLTRAGDLTNGRLTPSAPIRISALMRSHPTISPERDLPFSSKPRTRLFSRTIRFQAFDPGDEQIVQIRPMQLIVGRPVHFLFLSQRKLPITSPVSCSRKTYARGVPKRWQSPHQARDHSAHAWRWRSVEPALISLSSAACSSSTS